MKTFIPLFLFICVLNLISFAATRTAVSSGNVNAAATWSGGVFPGAGDDIIINDNVNLTINIDLPFSAGNLTLIGSAQISLSGRALTVGSLTGSTNSIIYNGSGGGAKNFTCINAANTTFAGRITGNVNFIKGGAGTLTLTNNSAYTGVTIIQNGGLEIANPSGSIYNNGLVAGVVTVKNGATLLLSRQDFWGTHVTANAARVVVEQGGVVSSNGYFNTLTNLTLTGGQLQSIGGNNPWESFALKGTVTTSGTTQSIIRSPSGSYNKVKIGTNAAGGSTTFNVGNDVTEDDLLISSLLENNKNNSSAFVASNFIKTGSGTVNLTAANEFSGNYTHTNGDTKVSNNKSLGTGTAIMNGIGRFMLQDGVTIANPLTINLSSPGIGFGSITSQTGTTTWSGNIAVNTNQGNGGHFASLGTKLNITGVITGAPGVIVTHRDGVITYSGGGTADEFFLLQGTATLGRDNGLPSNAIFSQNHPDLITTLDLTDFNQAFSGLKAQNSGQKITNSKATVTTLTLNGTQNTTETFNGSITGNIKLVLTGATTQILTGTNTYTGTTIIAPGCTLRVGAGGSVGSIVGNIVNNGTLIIDRGNAYTISGVISGSGTLIKEGAGTLTLTGANTYTGETQINAGTLRAGSGSAVGTVALGTQINSSATFDINGQMLGAEEFILNGGTMVNNGVDQVDAVQKVRVIANSFIGGTTRWDVRNLSTADGYVIINSPFTLTKQDANTIIFVRGTITNNGSVVINNGVLSLQTNPAFAGTGSYTVNNSGTLNVISFGGPTVLTNNVNVNNGARIGSTDNLGGNSSIAGTVTLSGSSTINTTVGFDISGVIAGTGNYIKTGTGTLTLSGNNTYSGSTTVNDGVLKLNSSTALGSITGVTIVEEGASIDLNGVNYSLVEPITIKGNGYNSGGVIVNSNTTTATFAGLITMNGNSVLTTINPYTLSGNILGTNYNLIKNGSKALTFGSNSVIVNNFSLNAGAVNAGSSVINIYENFTKAGSAIFTPNTGEVAFVGAAAQTVPNVGFYDLRINNTAGVSLSANTNVGGTVYMQNGILTTGTYTIDLGSTGNLNETTPNAQAPTSYIIGNVTTTRNVLKNTANSFGGIGLTLTESTINSNNTQVTRTTGTASTVSSGKSSIKREFEITPATNTGLNASMTFSYFDHETTGHLEDSLILYRYNGTEWIDKQPTVVNKVTNTLSYSGITAFSRWTASDKYNQPLPITLLNFKVKATNDNQIAINWKTIKEENNAYFTIEKSVNGTDWVLVEEINGAGSSSQPLTYNTVDTNPFEGVSYYRLKQTDYDGKFVYFKIVPTEINYEAVNSFECNIYPSPATVDNMNMLISSEELGLYQVTISNAVGNLLYSTRFNHQEKSAFIDLSNTINDYNFGTYFITVLNGKSNVCRQKIIIE